MVFRTSVALLALLVAAAMLAPAAFGDMTARAQALTLAWGGWLYLVIVFAVLVFLLWVAIGRLGTLRIGGEDAEPEFTLRSWFAMLFSAGMGIGLVFWGAAEPLSHYFTPPEGATGATPVAAATSMRYAYFHWGLHPWAIYALMGLGIAWFQHNRGQRGLVSDLVAPLAGRFGGATRVVDVFAVVATAIGVATTLGLGAAQIAAGVGRVTGLATGVTMQMIVIAVAFVLFMASSASGLTRGIKWLSNVNLTAAAALLVLVLVIGPTAFLFETFTTTLGGYLDSLPRMSLRMTPFSQRTWVGDWTVFYWAWWISWAPFVGAFFARISYGRTVRQFVAGVVLAPALVSFLWFAAFGGTALHQQMFGDANLADALAMGHQHVLFAMFEGMPWPTVLSWVAIVLLAGFFVTSADSATLVLAQMSSGIPGDPGFARKLTWGVLQVSIAAALLLVGGLEALQAVVIVAALPFALLLIAVIASLYRVLADDLAAREREARELLRAERRWLARERGDDRAP